MSGQSSAFTHRPFGRVKYFSLSLLIGFVTLATKQTLSSNPGVMVSILLALLALSLVFAYLRSKDIGQSSWWVLLSCIPGFNFWAAYRFIAYPAGFARHQTSDRAMRILSWIFGLCLASFLFALVASMVIPMWAKYRQGQLSEPRTSPAAPVDAQAAAAADMERQIIASRDRVFARYPWLADPNDVFRKQFEAYLEKSLKDPALASLFNNVDWPEIIAHRWGVEMGYLRPDGSVITKQASPPAR
jgi:hypothetical protein